MIRFHANITLTGPPREQIIDFLNAGGYAAYVAPTIKSSTVIFHQDMDTQESLAAALSRQLDCLALLVMDYNETILLYQLYVGGVLADAYVSEPHDDLADSSQPMPQGDTQKLCAAYGMEHRAPSVDRILHRPTDPTGGYALAVNRHGELARALGLPLIAAGASFESIDIGELPAAQGFDPAELVRTGDRQQQ